MSINFLDSQAEGSNTTHYSVLDREGNTVEGLPILLMPLQNWGAAESILVDPQTGLITGVNDLRRQAGSTLAY